MFLSRYFLTSTLVHTVVLACLFVLGVSSAQAAVIVRTADQLEVSEGKIAEGELLGVGLPVVLSDDVTDDVTLVGNKVKVSSSLGSDLLAAGFFVDVDGTVADDVRIIGGEVTISEAIAGDLILLAGTVHILSNASIGGDVVVYGGTVDIAGSVEGNVLGAMEALRIDAPIGGRIDVTVGYLTLGPEAKITESVVYASDTLLTQALSTNVQGDIIRNDPLITREVSARNVPLMLLLTGLFSSLVWYLFARRTLAAIATKSITHTVRSMLFGLGALLLVPLLFGVLVVSQIGLYVAAAVLFGFLTLLLVAGAAAPAIVGRLTLQLVGQKPKTNPLAIVIGTLILALCFLIPVIGFVILLLVTVAAFGSMLDLVSSKSR